jgi:4-hydroxybenzoate polyprenyltransferase
MAGGGARAWLELLRWHKPSGRLILLIPAGWALWLNAAAPPSPVLVGWIVLGALAVSGAGCIANDLWDRRIDRLVERTRNRPLAAGRVGVAGAVALLVGCLLAAIFTKPHKLPPALVTAMKSSLLGFVGYSLFMGFVVGFIDNAAHIGGLIGGFAIGMVLAEKFDEDEYARQGTVRLAAAIVIATLLLMGAWSWLPRAAA